MDPATTHPEAAGPRDTTRLREIEVLTASYLALQDRCEALQSELVDERSRRLHDLADLHALSASASANEAAAAELRARHEACERRIDELGTQLHDAHTRLAQLHEAQADAAWAPHVLRLRQLWRRLPRWIRGPIHALLAGSARAVDRMR